METRYPQTPEKSKKCRYPDHWGIRGADVLYLRKNTGGGTTHPTPGGHLHPLSFMRQALGQVSPRPGSTFQKGPPYGDLRRQH